MITPSDMMILISASGETDEILKLVLSLQAIGNPVIAMTSKDKSTLAKHADAVPELHMDSECCPDKPDPTTSTTPNMAIGDALAVSLMRKRRFRPDDFARRHHGVARGRRLLKRVGDAMRHKVPGGGAGANFQTVIQKITGGCQDMVAMLRRNGELAGIITDGVLRRFMKRKSNFTGDLTTHIMTPAPLNVLPEMLINDAEALMHKQRTSALSVTGEQNKTEGLIRIFD